jgi:poly-gamma-glutamate synthesis protein (capsule biosynthesis protein)
MRQGMVVGIVAALLGLGLTACADPEPAAEPPAAGPTSTTGPAAAGAASTPNGSEPSSAATSAAPLTPDSTVTLAFGGDVHFEGRVADLLSTPDGLAALRPILGSADVAVVNLETAITERGVEQPKIYHFRTTPQALVTLQQAGVDAVSMANNHAVDYGPDGLTDTLEAQAASPIPVIGIGQNADKAFAPAVFDVRGTRVAVLASSQVNDFTVHSFPATDAKAGIAGNLDNTRLLAAVQAARAAYDVVVVYLHWGTDYATCPDAAQARHRCRPRQRRRGRRRRRARSPGSGGRLAGSDLRRVRARQLRLAQHPWTQRRRERCADGECESGTSASVARKHRPDGAPSIVTDGSWTPLIIGDDGVPRPPTGSAATSQQAAWEQARSCARLAAAAP